MEKSAIILAGGSSRRLGQDKGSVRLAGKPLILHVLDRVSTVVEEVIVVVRSEVQGNAYASFLESKARIVIDKHQMQSPLIGALAGFESARGDYSLLVPCDSPFISSQIASILLKSCVGKDAIVPRWPNSFIEPLHASYFTKSAMVAANRALESRRLDMRSMISRLEKVSYLSTLALEQIDPMLLTFLNVNTFEDLKKVEHLLECVPAKVEAFDSVRLAFQQSRRERDSF